METVHMNVLSCLQPISHLISGVNWNEKCICVINL